MKAASRTIVLQKNRHFGNIPEDITKMNITKGQNNKDMNIKCSNSHHNRSEEIYDKANKDEYIY